jgi:aspartate kinase
MALFSIACQKEGLKTISLTGSQAGVLTNANHTHAMIQSVLGERLLDALNKCSVVVVAGFQGVDHASKEITTLGRGGSDLTAVAMAVRFGVSRVEIFKDVQGIYNSMTASSGRHLFRKLSWLSAYRMSLFGASVIHSRAAFLAYKNNIEIDVRCSLTPTEEGTLIGKECEMESAMIRSKTVIKAGMLIKTRPSADLNMKMLAHLEVVHISRQPHKGEVLYWVNLDNAEGREALPDFIKDKDVTEIIEEVTFRTYFGGGLLQDQRISQALFKAEQDEQVLALFVTPEFISLACSKYCQVDFDNIL